MSYEEEYLLLSANYCCQLFDVSQIFFKANVDVEQKAAIRSLDKPVDFPFKHYFKLMSQKTEGLLSVFTAYMELHLKKNPQDSDLFFEQLSRVKELHTIAGSLAQKTQSLRENSLLQEQLWDDDEYTDLFTRCCLLICYTNEWQCNLARSVNLKFENEPLR